MPWTPGFALLMFLMWAIMMLAMMLPSAAPMLLLFDSIARKRREHGQRGFGTALFAAGYLGVWGGFSLAATTLQYILEQLLLMSMAMRTTSAALAGALLIGAGLYQFAPWKLSCLKHCQSPLAFIMGHWRDGSAGALVMGWRHGLYCLGCCWLLMGLLFVGGVMNLAWIAALTLYVAVEKLVPAAHWLGRLAGAALVAWGGLTLARLAAL
jgi:predicted metal-binding membrane protein